MNAGLELHWLYDSTSKILKIWCLFSVALGIATVLK